MRLNRLCGGVNRNTHSAFNLPGVWVPGWMRGTSQPTHSRCSDFCGLGLCGDPFVGERLQVVQSLE